MCKCTVVFLLLALSAAVSSYEIIPVIKHDQDLKFDGTYFYEFETANGIAHKAVGDAEKVKGTYSYTSPEGEQIEVIYTADTDGFQASGAHIPSVPEHVFRMLEYQRTHPRVYDPYNHGL